MPGAGYSVYAVPMQDSTAAGPVFVDTLAAASFHIKFGANFTGSVMWIAVYHG